MLVNLIDGSYEPLDRLRRALAASGVVGTFAWDHVRGTVVYDGSAAALLTGDPSLAETEVHGSAAIAAVHPGDRDWLVEHMQRSIAQGGLVLAEYRVISARNEVRWLLSRGRTTLDKDGKPVSTDGIIIDITESREAGNRYVVSPRPPADESLDKAKGLDRSEGLDHVESSDRLEEIADLAILIRRRIDPAASPSLMTLADLLLFQVGREIAGGSDEPE